MTSARVWSRLMTVKEFRELYARKDYEGMLKSIEVDDDGR